MKTDMKTEIETCEIQIPFAGFYESKWSAIVDHWLEMEIENYSESEYMAESFPPLPETFAQFGESELGEMLWESMDYRAAHMAIAKDYCESFWEMICEEMGIPKEFAGIEFSGMESPREYNFQTDRIFARVSIRSLRLIRKLAESDPDQFRETLKSRHKSRDGFISFYSHDPIEWRKSVSEMDHNELETVLICAMEIAGLNDSEFEWNIYYPIAENDYSYCDSAMDWDSAKEKWAELRAEKIEEIAEEFAENQDWQSIADFADLIGANQLAEIKGRLNETPAELAELLGEIESRNDAQSIRNRLNPKPLKPEILANIKI